jgi:polyisoprenoid-binding protein YceI
MAKRILFAVILVFVMTGMAGAQLPAGVYAGTSDFTQSAAGIYAVDPDHTAVIAKVSHLGYGLSVFRFDTVSGTLKWDPARPDKSALAVTVATASIATPVAGFATELTGPEYLNAGKYPDATFISTGFRQTDPTHGAVHGQFTLMGKTVPLTFAVLLTGAGKGFMGHPRIGVEATGQIDPRVFGLSPMLGSSVLLIIDAEFAQGG